MNGPDEELAREAKRGSQVAFASLVRRNQSLVRGFLRKMTADTATADDLAQETFVRVWQRRRQFAAGRAVKPWILGIAVNLARNRLRWWRLRPTVSLDEWAEVPERVNGPTENGSHNLELAERASAVRAAIAALPPKFREALVLFEYEHMSYAEIAEALSTTVKTIENRIARARDRLRRTLQRWAPT